MSITQPKKVHFWGSSTDLFDTTSSCCDQFGKCINEWGNTSGIPPTATILSFVAKPAANKVFLEWQIDETLPITGVNVFRSEERDAKFVKVNAVPIPLEPTGKSGGTYTYLDNSITSGKTYYYRLEMVWKEGTTSLQPDMVSIHIPAVFALHQNYPNPFNINTAIRFSIPGPRESEVKLAVYNVLGQKVRTLLNGIRNEGEYSVEWDGKDDFNNQLPSGLYFYKLQAGSFRETKKLVLVK